MSLDQKTPPQQIHIHARHQPRRQGEGWGALVRVLGGFSQHPLDRHHSIAYCGDIPDTGAAFASLASSSTSRSSTSRLSGGCDRSSRSARAISRSARISSRRDLYRRACRISHQ